MLIEKRENLFGEDNCGKSSYKKIFQPVLIAIFVSLLFQQSAEYPGVK